MLTISGIEELKTKIGEELGVSDWHEVTQEAIDAFADATGDHQWIHVDPERASGTPFGDTIAHGLYTLSLGPKLSDALFSIGGFAFGLNYGYGRVRFPAPLPVGSRVRERERRPGRRPHRGHPDVRARRQRQAGVRRRIAGPAVHRGLAARPQVLRVPAAPCHERRCIRRITHTTHGRIH
jgi:acyl dehydratase